MGFNTTVVIYNDALEYIEKDPGFGRRLTHAALAAFSPPNCPVNLDTINRDDEGQPTICASAGQVIETHHADYATYVKVGGNTGHVVEDPALEVVRAKAQLKRAKTLSDKARKKEVERLHALMCSMLQYVPAGALLHAEVTKELKEGRT